MSVGIILLAAGSSSRLGQSKQLLPVGGQTLLERSAKIALASGVHKTIVVLGSNEAAHREAIRNYPVEIIVNPEWQKGMGSSLKTGLQHLISIAPKTQAVLVMVCDQPKLEVSHLQKLIVEFGRSEKSIIASFYKNSPGVPAIFAGNRFEELLNLDDQQGAKKIILQQRDNIGLVNFPEGAVDLDTPEDYHNFLVNS
jgi:molybdenum cofactor cytidylyltransferase